MGGARNDAELAKLLAPRVMKGLQIMGEEHLEPDIRDQIQGRLSKDYTWYRNGGPGSLSESWSTQSETYGGILMGSMKTYYDSSKLAHDPWGRHMTPSVWVDSEYHVHYPSRIEEIEDMATLIDKGRGGPLFGPDNPTMDETNFWAGGVIPSFDSNRRAWIKSGLTKAGLKVL